MPGPSYRRAADLLAGHVLLPLTRAFHAPSWTPGRHWAHSQGRHGGHALERFGRSVRIDIFSVLAPRSPARPPAWPSSAWPSLSRPRCPTWALWACQSWPLRQDKSLAATTGGTGMAAATTTYGARWAPGCHRQHQLDHRRQGAGPASHSHLRPAVDGPAAASDGRGQHGGAPVRQADGVVGPRGSRREKRARDDLTSKTIYKKMKAS